MLTIDSSDKNAASLPAWTPSDECRARARITVYMAWLAKERGLRFADYNALWQWSVDDLEGFWQSIWDYFGLRSATPHRAVLSDRNMPGARWFEGATVNFVDQVFRHVSADPDDERVAIVAGNESGDVRKIGWRELRRQVASLAAALREMGVQPGDRVVAYLPNIPETVVAFLAVASVGAVWSVAAPDLGSASVLDRFRQIEPKILIACDAYRYGGKLHERGEVVAELLRELPTVQHLISVALSGDAGSPSAFSAPARPSTRRA
jgi:acetoacetyl-CoA synthetase